MLEINTPSEQPKPQPDRPAGAVPNDAWSEFLQALSDAGVMSAVPAVLTESA